MAKREFYDEYIVFVLGCDNFKVCEKIRTLAKEWGADSLYEDCVYLAQKFNLYDSDKYNYLSQYESLCKFLQEYENEIDEYLENGTKFEIKGD